MQKVNSQEHFLTEAMNVRDAIIRLNMFRQGTEFISLGFNCSTAHYLREVGLRNAAYPFDWVFSSAEIIIDACQDSFNAFMDSSQWEQHDKASNVMHKRYHEYFFAHKDPLTNQDDYGHYQRACQRIKQRLASTKPICFVITLITEPEKRPGWALGFTQVIKKPATNTIESVLPLLDYLRRVHPNSVFVIIEHYTEVHGTASLISAQKDVLHLRFCAEGKSTGKKYVEEVDDQCFKVMLSGLAHGQT